MRPKVGVCPSMTENISSKLVKAQISISDIITLSLEKLSSDSNVPVKDLLIIRQELIARHCAPLTSAGKVYDEMLLSLGAFSTGNDRVDEMLDGGIMCGEIVELFGAAATGKTQMCLEVCAHLTLTTKHTVLFIDSCGSFSAQRLQQIMTENGATQQMRLDALSRVLYHSCYDAYQLIGFLDQIIQDNKQGKSDSRCVKVIVVDSVAALVVPLLTNTNFKGVSVLNRIANKLKILSTAFYKTILLTNERVEWGGDGARPALGQYWSTVPHIRLHLSGDENPSCGQQQQLRRRIQIHKSTRSEIGKYIDFKLDVTGIQDYPANI